MSGEKGRSFLLLTPNPDNPAQYYIMGGLKTKTYQIDNKTVETTNKDSAEAQELLVVIQSAEFAGVGTYKDTLAETLCLGFALDKLPHQFLILFENSTGFSGLFIVTQLKYTGESNGMRTYDITLRSHQQIEFEQGFFDIVNNQGVSVVDDSGNFLFEFNFTS